MLCGDFLQQNAFTAYDRACPLYKGYWMLKNILLVHDLAQKAVTEGIPQEQEKEAEEEQEREKEKEAKSTRKVVVTTWAKIRNCFGDLLYEVVKMRFEDPRDGEDRLVAK